MPKLVVRHPELGDLTFQLTGERITVGRRADNTVQIDHATVSAHHAELVNSRCGYLIRDLRSTNHSYIGGVKFIEAELDRPCKLVLGTVECDYLPDAMDAPPEELESLRKTVGLLRRQNDELVAKIAQQQNQIDILGHARLFTPAAGADYQSLQEQVKALSAERHRLAAEVRELRSALEARATSPAPADASGSPSGDDPVIPAADVTVSIRRVAVSEPAPPPPAPEPASGEFQHIALLAEKLRAWIATLALQPADTKGFGVILQLVDEMNKQATALDSPPLCAIISHLEALLSDAGLQPGPVNERIIHTAAQSAEFLGKLLTEGILSRAGNIAPPRVITIADKRDLLPAIIASLQAANLETIGCSDAHEALHTLRETPCNLILLDADLAAPGIADICARIRAQPRHGRTPILFLTSPDTTEPQHDNSPGGTTDFICKPVNMFELALKAHTWALKNQFTLA